MKFWNRFPALESAVGLSCPAVAPVYVSVYIENGVWSCSLGLGDVLDMAKGKNHLSQYECNQARRIYSMVKVLAY